MWLSIFLSLCCNLVLWYELNKKLWDILLFPNTELCIKEINIAVTSMMTCQIGSMWHHRKTLFSKILNLSSFLYVQTFLLTISSCSLQDLFLWVKTNQEVWYTNLSLLEHMTTLLSSSNDANTWITLATSNESNRHSKFIWKEMVSSSSWI